MEKEMEALGFCWRCYRDFFLHSLLAGSKSAGSAEGRDGHGKLFDKCLGHHTSP